jgi:uncharacterized Zn-binding protein involved in type VI secretion
METRSNLFGRAQIILGDKTSHGGVVISASATTKWHGVPVVRKTDRVYCPKCKPHFFEIVEGLENCKDRGLQMATEGHLTTCGAVLIAETAGDEIVRHAMRGHVEEFTHDQHFQVIDEVTNLPAANRKYRITYSGGVIESTTNEDGLTAVVTSTSAEAVELAVF